MAGQQEEYDLGLSLGGLYKGNSSGDHRGRAVSEENEVAAAPRARAVSLPTEREMELMREGLTEVQALSRVMAASLKLTIKERTDRVPAAAARLSALASAGGSGRLAATSSTVSGELMSTDRSSNRPAVNNSMMAKENADDPQQDPARRSRHCNRYVARPIRRDRRATTMPHVKTIGADGKRVEGFLYKYLTGKVRIVCICHGFFQSPAEFVNHAGGRVGNPFKQIKVSL